MDSRHISNIINAFARGCVRSDDVIIPLCAEALCVPSDQWDAQSTVNVLQGLAALNMVCVEDAPEASLHGKNATDMQTRDLVSVCLDDRSDSNDDQIDECREAYADPIMCSALGTENSVVMNYTASDVHTREAGYGDVENVPKRGPDIVYALVRLLAERLVSLEVSAVSPQGVANAAWAVAVLQVL